MNVLLFFTCTYVILYFNSPSTWANIPKHTNNPIDHARISKHYDTYSVSASLNKHYDTAGVSAIPNKNYDTYGVIASINKHSDTSGVSTSIAKHRNNNIILPPKLPSLSKLRNPAYHDAERRDIKGSAFKTDERGISDSSVGTDGDIDIKDDNDYESDIVNEDKDVNTDFENDVDDLIIQDNYEKLISEVNGINMLESFSGHLKSSRTSGILDVVKVLLKFIAEFKEFYTPAQSSNEECLKDIRVYGDPDNKYKYPINGSLWSILMADAWGKLPDGFIFGNVHIPGMYEECQEIKTHYVLKVKHKNPDHPFWKPVWVDEPRNITGRYCQVHYKFTNESLPSTRMGTVIALLKAPVPFSYGTCIPDSCTLGDMQESLNKTFNDEVNAGLELIRIVCHKKASYKEMRQIDAIVLSILCMLFGLMVVFTLVDLITTQFNMSNFRSGKLFKVMEAFSFISNMKKIFTYDPPESGTITCLPGIRVITMLWIVMCHQYGRDIDFIANSADALKYQDPVLTQIVTNGWIAVDTFLYVGGLVLGYHMFPRLLSGKMINPFSILLRMLMRMVPSILFLAAFCFSLLRFLAYGPRAYILEKFVDKCNIHWWKDALFINNFIFPDNQGHVVNDCLDHCWYTAVHMQLALVTVFLLLVFVKRKIYGIITVAVCSLVAIVVPLSITIAYDLPPSPLWPISLDLSFEYMWRVYLVPWCRAGPWVVGIWTALALRSSRLTKINIPMIVVILGYIAAISLGLTIVLGLYPYNHVHIPLDKKWTTEVAALYGSLARPAWALCVAWVVFTCHTNNAGTVNATLSWPGWRPLGRLTFSMYLVAPVVQLWWSTTQFVPVYYNYQAKLFETAGVLFISGVSGLFLSVLVEVPCISLVRLVAPSMLSHSSMPDVDTQIGLVNVSEEELNDVKLYPSLEEMSTSLYDEDKGRKLNVIS